MFYAYVEWKDGAKEAYEHVSYKVAWEMYLKWWRSAKYAHVKFGKHEDE